MRQRVMRACGTAIVLLVTPASLSAQNREPVFDGLRLRADAGLGGVVRPGRWAPVRVSIEDDGTDVAGELIIEWGESTLRRDVVLAAASRAQLELYVRSMEPRDSMTVRLASKGVTLRAVDVPVRVAPAEDAFTVCVTSGDWLGDIVPGCTGGLAVSALPRSMRGYDAADALIWRAGPESVLAADQHSALQRWRAYHALEESALLSRAPRLPPPAAGDGISRSLGRLTGGVVVYLVSLGAAGWFCRRAGRPLWTYATLTVLAGMAVTASVLVGRIGPGSAVVVWHATTLQQIPGGSLVSTRGVIEYPAFDAFALRAAVPDGALEARRRRVSEQRFDENGYPLLAGTFGLGHREEFALEGLIDVAPLDVVRNAHVVRVSNASSADLRDCRFPEGFSRRLVGTLAPGQAEEAEEVAGVDAPFFTCTLSRAPFDFFDPRIAVRMEGTALVSAYLPPLASSDVVAEGSR